VCPPPGLPAKWVYGIAGVVLPNKPLKVKDLMTAAFADELNEPARKHANGNYGFRPWFLSDWLSGADYLTSEADAIVAIGLMKLSKRLF